MLTLSVPGNERSALKHTAETRPRAASEWLARLPFASPPDAAQQLTYALFSLNRQPLGADERLALLAVYRPVVERVAASLEDLLANAGVPPLAPQRQAGVLLRELLIEHSTGYKHVLLALANPRFGRATPRRTAEVVARLLMALRDLQAACYLTYAPLPEGVWLEMHQVHDFAQSSDLAGLSVDGLPSASLVYRQALLLALADPPHMSPQELAHTRMILDTFGTLATLGTSPPPAGHAGFAIDADSDHGPLHQAPGPDACDWWLDTDALGQHLYDTAVRLRTGDTPRRLGLPPDMDSGLLMRLCKHLYALWKAGADRAFKRYPVTDETVQVVAGVAAIHRLLELVPQQAELKPETGHDLPVRDARSFFAALVAVNATRWNVSNDSANGLALSGSPDGPLNLKVGEALAVRGDDAAAWSLAVIRWIKMPNPRQVQLGVERLSPRIQPAWVHTLRGHRKDHPEPALFLPGLPALKQPDRLLLPRDLHHHGIEADVWQPPRQFTVSFGRRIEQTACFDLTEFSVLAPSSPV